MLGPPSLFRRRENNVGPTKEDRIMFDWLESTSLALWVKESWGWPLALTIHAFGSATIVGFAFIIGLRLFGLFGTIPLAALRALFPFIWFCVVIQVLSGTLLWLTKPGRYLEAGVFEVKLAFIVTGIVVTLYLEKALNKGADNWASGTISARSIRFVVATALVWSAVLIAGRLTAYLGIYTTAIPR
jgi:hypothetical protein